MSTQTSAAAAGNRPLAGRRVLIADDGSDNRLLLKTHLVRAGAQAEAVPDGRAAVTRALLSQQEGQPFDVILMDMQMPEMDGYAATQALRREGCRIPIVALTALDEDGDRDNCLSAGCDDYMRKPISRGALVSMVVRYAGQRATVHKEVLVPRAGSAKDLKIGEVSLEPLRSDYADDPEMTDIITMFVRGLPEKANALEEAMKSGDVGALMTLAHQIKGAGGGYGFGAISVAAGTLEEHARRGDAEALPAQVAELAALLRRAVAPESAGG